MAKICITISDKLEEKLIRESDEFDYPSVPEYLRDMIRNRNIILKERVSEA